MGRAVKYKAAPEPGTIADLVLRYRKSPRVLGWAPSTRAACDKTLGDFMARNGRNMVAELRRGDIIAMRDGEFPGQPGAANNWLKVIAGLLDYAADIEMIQSNPARGIRRLKLKPGGFRTWREDEIEAFKSHWPRGSLERRTFTLALCTGAAASDLVRLGWANVTAERIRYNRQKTGVAVSLPIHADLAEELALVPRSQMTFAPMRADYVRQFLRRAVNEAGLGAPDDQGRHLTPHGLRKALGRRLAEAGADVHAIMAILGHESIASAQVYTRAYDRARAADAGMEKLAGAVPSNVRRLKR